MRILILTNFYRLNQSGGEDQSCQQVVAGLRQRGHVALVLTSMQGTGNVPVQEEGVQRSLYLEMDLVPWRHSVTFFFRRRMRERKNLQCFERVAAGFAPDIVFIWGMWNLPRSLAALAEAQYPGKVVYRFASYWPTLPSQHAMYWRAPGRGRFSRLVKRVLGRLALAILARENHTIPLAFTHAICVSAATRSHLVELGVPVSHARVIHTGVDASRYPPRPDYGPARRPDQGLSLLYAGRLVAEKGVDTLIKALAQLVDEHGQPHIRLTVAGTEAADYERYLRQLVAECRLQRQVIFLGHVPAAEMPQLLQKHDVLVVPSLWPEPFSRMLLEGMLARLVVVATPTGGTTEILLDGENGLLFPPGDHQALAHAILRLVCETGLRQRLADAGQQTAAERFTSTKMLDAIEAYLQEVASGRIGELAGRQ